MIVCESPKFVFVHIFKSAGTSVKRALRRFAMPAWHEYANFFFKRMGISQFGPPRYPDHMRASELIAQIGIEQFKSHFSFSFVRNPWDRELSHYRYILKKPKHTEHETVSRLGSFGEYIRWRCDGRFMLQKAQLVYENELIVDFVGRFENLDGDFRYCCNRLGIKSRLPKLNSSGNSKYQLAYDEHTTELVARTFRQDIRLFGYEFEATKRDAA